MVRCRPISSPMDPNDKLLLYDASLKVEGGTRTLYDACRVLCG